MIIFGAPAEEIQAELPPMLQMDLAYWIHGRRGYHYYYYFT